MIKYIKTKERKNGDQSDSKRTKASASSNPALISEILCFFCSGKPKRYEKHDTHKNKWDKIQSFFFFQIKKIDFFFKFFGHYLLQEHWLPCISARDSLRPRSTGARNSQILRSSFPIIPLPTWNPITETNQLKFRKLNKLINQFMKPIETQKRTETDSGRRSLGLGKRTIRRRNGECGGCVVSLLLLWLWLSSTLTGLCLVSFPIYPNTPSCLFQFTDESSPKANNNANC